MLPRTLEALISYDLREKMVFLSGPRQVGKTTVARAVLAKAVAGAYYSWDSREDRKSILGGVRPPPPALIVLDELHKFRSWKRWLKGEFDKHRTEYEFLVTGSARLDVYRKGGDSLQGRYHHRRLHPLSMMELGGQLPQRLPFEPLTFGTYDSGSEELLQQLLERGGFPEPFFASTARAQRRWHKERLERFFREDVRELELVRDLSSMEMLAEILPSRVGSPLSLNALREDLEVTHGAVNHWVDILERMYFLFRIPPFVARTVRSLKKEPKAYLWDWSLVTDPGARFENLVASHLLKLCHHLEDHEGYRAKLHYLRDRDGREVDFLVAVDKKPWFIVEAKLDDQAPSRHLHYFRERLNVPLAYQFIASPGHSFIKNGVHVVSASTALKEIA